MAGITVGGAHPLSLTSWEAEAKNPASPPPPLQSSIEWRACTFAATSRRISTAFADSRCVDSCNAAIDFLFGIPAKCLLASPFTYAPLKEKEEVSAVKPAVPKVAKPGKGFIKRQRTVRLCYSTPAGLIAACPIPVAIPRH